MNTTTRMPNNSTANAGLSTPHPSETHQKATRPYSLESTGGDGFAARLLANPGCGNLLHKAGPVYIVEERSGYRYAISDQWVKSHHVAAARALDAALAIGLGNNGHADVGTDPDLATALEAVGFTVLRTTDLHGRIVYRGFTARAQAALRGQPYAVSTYQPPSPLLNLPDVEPAILARQDRHLEGA